MTQNKLCHTCKLWPAFSDDRESFPDKSVTVFYRI